MGRSLVCPLRCGPHQAKGPASSIPENSSLWKAVTPVELAAPEKLERGRRVQRAYVLLVSLLVLSVRLSGQQPYALFNDAVAQLRAGNLNRGCAEAEQAARQDPRFYAAHNLLGLCAVQRGDLRAAETHFRKTLELNPKFLDARLNLGVNLIEQGKMKVGIAELKQGLRQDPNNAKALWHLGKAELASGAAAEAIQHLRRANELAPGNVRTALLLAQAHLAAGQKEAALPFLASIVESERETQLLMSVALAAVQASEMNLAREALEKILQRDPDHLSHILCTARDLSDQGEYAQVRTLLEAVEPFGRDSAEWNALLGYAEYRLRDPASSASHLRCAVELAPEEEEYYMKLGEMLLFYNSEEVAAETFKSGLARLPDSAILNYGLAVSYWAHDSSPDMARTQVEKTLSLHPDYVPALLLRTDIAARERDWKGVGELADHLQRVAPKAYNGYYLKAMALTEGQFSQLPTGAPAGGALEVRRLLGRSIKLNPNFPGAHNALGKFLLKRKELSLAIAEFEKAAQLLPDDSEAYYHLMTAYRLAGNKEKSAQAMAKVNELKNKKKPGWEVLFRVAK